MSRRVVLSGIGCLSAAGSEPEQLRLALRRGGCLGRPERIDLGRGDWLETSVARLAEVSREAYLPPARQRRMSLLSQNWVVACLKARSDAGLRETPAPARTAVCMGTGLGCLASTLEYLDILQRDGLSLGNPFLFSESVANAPAGHAAIELDCRGVNLTLTCGDASGVAAVDAGAHAIREGRADLVYAGGVEQAPAAFLAVLARLGALAATRGRVRDRWRAPLRGGGGIVPGEGFVCFVLEDWERARSRGAAPYAEVRMGACVSDPEASDAGWSLSPAVRAEALGRALRGSGVRSDEVDGAVLHACGHPAADRAEEEALERAVLAERPPSARELAVQRPSRVVGQFAAAGAVSVAAAALALRHQEVYPQRPGPLSQVAEAGRDGARDLRHLLVSAASWGGTCMGLVLSRASG